MGRRINKTKGFTIIEVMFVLAIAGLILAIVFLAVPALERNQRNTARKEDLGRLSAAIIQYISDNNNRPPGYIGGAWDNSLNQATIDTNGILADAGELSGYHLVVNSPITTSGNPNGPDGISMVTGNNSLPNSLAANVGMQLQIVIGALCTTGGNATNLGASRLNIAIQYTLESPDYFGIGDYAGVYCWQSQ